MRSTILAGAHDLAEVVAAAGETVLVTSMLPPLDVVVDVTVGVVVGAVVGAVPGAVVGIVVGVDCGVEETMFEHVESRELRTFASVTFDVAKQDAQAGNT